MRIENKHKNLEIEDIDVDGEILISIQENDLENGKTMLFWIEHDNIQPMIDFMQEQVDGFSETV